MDYSYEINPCKTEFGLGWELRLFRGNAELETQVFPIRNTEDDMAAQLQSAYNDALLEAKDWLRSKKPFKIAKARPVLTLAVLALPVLLTVALLLLLSWAVSDIYIR